MNYTRVVHNGLSPLYSKKMILILSNIMEDIPILLYDKNKKNLLAHFFFTNTTFSTLNQYQFPRNIIFKLHIGIYLFKLQVRKSNGYKFLINPVKTPTFWKETMIIIYYEINVIH